MAVARPCDGPKEWYKDVVVPPELRPDFDAVCEEPLSSALAMAGAEELDGVVAELHRLTGKEPGNHYDRFQLLRKGKNEALCTEYCLGARVTTKKCEDNSLARLRDLVSKLNAALTRNNPMKVHLAMAIIRASLCLTCSRHF